jgi:hypothetical protein
MHDEVIRSSIVMSERRRSVTNVMLLKHVCQIGLFEYEYIYLYRETPWRHL